jgi:hypothetical protein
MSNQIRDLDLVTLLLAVHAHIVGPMLFTVAHDIYCISPEHTTEQLAVRMVTRPSSLEIEGCS